MSLFSLRRPIAAFDLPATPGTLDTLAPTSKKPLHLREVRDTSLSEVHPHRDAAREAAFALARAWGLSKRRTGEILMVDGKPGAGSLTPNDLAALHAAVDSGTAAVLIDAGAAGLDTPYCQGAAQLCRTLQILLIIDDSTAGLAQTAERRWGVSADMLIGGGVETGTAQAVLRIRTHTDGMAAISEGNAWGSVPGHSVLARGAFSFT